MATLVFVLLIVGLLSVFALDIWRKAHPQPLKIESRSRLRRR